MTSHPDLWAALAAPFDESELRERKGTRGQMLRYITAPTAMNRLDEVLGPENWGDRTGPVPDGSGNYRCLLTVRLPDGARVTKSGIGAPGSSDSTASPGKSAASDAFKRAAVKFGVGRYLHPAGGPRFARRPDPAPAPPLATGPPARRGADGPPGRGDRGRWGGADREPGDGRALFGWAKRQEEHGCAGLLKYLTGWAKLQEFPPRMVEWDAAQVAEAYREGSRKAAELARSGELAGAPTD